MSFSTCIVMICGEIIDWLRDHDQSVAKKTAESLAMIDNPISALSCAISTSPNSWLNQLYSKENLFELMFH